MALNERRHSRVALLPAVLNDSRTRFAPLAYTAQRGFLFLLQMSQRHGGQIQTTLINQQQKKRQQ